MDRFEYITENNLEYHLQLVKRVQSVFCHCVVFNGKRNVQVVVCKDLFFFLNGHNAKKSTKHHLLD